MTNQMPQNMSERSTSGRGHVEMTNEIPMSDGSISNSDSCEDTSGDGDSDSDITAANAMTKAHGNRSCSSDEETRPLSPWGSWREEDNQSTSSNSSWATAIYRDMKFGMISNAIFFLGASIQTYTSIVDLIDAKEDALSDDDWDDDYDDDYVNSFADRIWYALYSVGPFLYLINSLIDIRWMAGQLESPWSWSFWCRCFSRDDSSSSVEIQSPEQQGQLERIIEVNMDNSEDRNNFDDDESYSTMDSSVDTAYDTELVWHIVAACVFGLGAFFEFYSTFLDDYYEECDDWDDDAYLMKVENRRAWYVSNYKMDFIGMHLYFLSGIIELIAQRNSYRRGINIKCCFGDIWRNNVGSHDDDEKDDSEYESPESDNPVNSTNRVANFLMFLGTVFFLCGITIDCTIAYISDPQLRNELDPSKRVIFNMNNVTLSIWDIVSSVLWNIDAILYICADILLYSLHKKDSKGRQWFCKKRASCSCRSDDHTMEEDEKETSIPSFPELEPRNDVAKPLLGSGSRTSYSSL
mmetsp:Transcript_914/g.1930  ORF Transcript_914/g.1930 Transcript_914/m.1930 type:complete len:522 (-) Transcript_914:85-1650(-)|eukprot:CAMPEP_0197173144 /NCGR_PEP_ID=MMETSP1423-20130617/176_1 /TAXON_ID=476441 /ORGANISM="Pseudo-nitzschia heimii, Strain UNC1101" /LENGTH=521 /DNA_ID=CAMNT_0042621909 /DNA_START=190 /DNA_END=1755 /DNA_ORIENTATION=+